MASEMKLATLLYIKNSSGDFLLMRRERNPNKGLLSPPGGKLHPDEAESPATCAVREAMEECSMNTVPSDWSLAGIITEKDFPGTGNIMIFLMRYKHVLNELPPPCNEGEFLFVNPHSLSSEQIPETDRQFIWKHILEESSEVFILSLDCSDYPVIRLI
jgi:8-oxo-dGTP diphosphatase